MRTSVKTCFKCHVEKPITDFYVHPQMGDGRLNKCKECSKNDVRENYRANVEHYREYERKRFQDAGRKENVRVYQRRRRDANPEKYQARNAVNNAIRDGRLDKPDHCEKCNATGRIEGHHPDYSKPLEVMWLCFICHRAEHDQDAVWEGDAA